ncbi:hypothetical protein U1Q18_019719 [Sarracenia purpurea var. burkii]
MMFVCKVGGRRRGFYHKFSSTVIGEGDLAKLLDITEVTSLEKSCFLESYFLQSSSFPEAGSVGTARRRNSNGEVGVEVQFPARGFSFSPVQTEVDLRWQVVVAVSPRGGSGGSGDLDDVGKAVVP